MTSFPAVVAALLLGVVADLPVAVAASPNTDPDIAKMQADADALVDANTGPAEIEARLRAALTVRDGMAMIHGQAIYNGSYTFPASDRWAVQCGIGLTVSFGATPRGDPNDIGAGPEIHLTFGNIEPAECDRIGFVVGEKIQVIMAGK